MAKIDTGTSFSNSKIPSIIYRPKYNTSFSPNQNTHQKRNIKIRCSNDTNPSMDWRAYRAKLVASNSNTVLSTRLSEPNYQVLLSENRSLAEEGLWAHPIGTPETGCLIIASSNAPQILYNEFSWQLVIFLVEYSRSGAIGYVLNRPSSLTMGRVPGISQSSELPKILSSNRLYCGGLQQQEMISVVHGVHDVHGAEEIIQGIYSGGDLSTSPSFMNGESSPLSFKFFSGYFKWGPGQLEEQINAGAWYCAASSRSFVLKQCLGLPVPLWVEAMRLMGGEFAEEAGQVYNNIEEELE